MPRKYSLGRADFARMRGFTRITGAYFSLSYGTIPGRTTPGFACVVSSKVESRAAKRNLIKRRCRAVFGKVAIPAGVYVYYAKKGAATISYEETERDIRSLIEKTRLA